MNSIHPSPLRLRADASRVVLRPFHLAPTLNVPGGRARVLVDQVLAMDMRTARTELALVHHDFATRHLQVQQIFLARYAEIAAHLELCDEEINDEKKELIGAYFCHEYSFAAAALMNPSATLHPDQSELAAGAVRVVIALRAVGEGHISSVAFREAVVGPGREIELARQPMCAMSASPVPEADAAEDPVITVRRHPNSSLSGTVIFPVTRAQKNGIEDLRLTRLDTPGGVPHWVGTYTAYSGDAIVSELLCTEDFDTFRLHPVRGPGGRSKGLALFPHLFDDGYRMIGRHDGKNIFLAASDELDCWDTGEVLVEPKFPWELVQIGNCGPPILIDEGWLLLTHGVGAMRKYSIGAVLLDRDDPSRVLGRTAQPILSAADEDREGYVPNVVYSCGGLRVGDDIFLPYGVADSSVAFAFVAIRDVLAGM